MKIFARQLAAMMLLMLGCVYGQTVTARVASLNNGNATLVSNGGTFRLKAGDVLKPGDVIDTRGGAQVLIEMSDGSVVIVRPGSQVTLKDFRTAGTLRDLFEIVSGRVRIKVNHWGGKPNPVRVNTPSASIAVRGTEFSVAVSGNETRVVVFEGLVEVSNLFSPQQRALVEPGQGVIVRPDEALRFFIPGPGSDIGERRDQRGNDNQQAGQNQTAQNNRGDVLRNLAGQYERYVDSYVEPGENAPLLRFLALPDGHLDSLENPAYATGFNLFTGRALLLPSVRSASNSAVPRDYGGITQLTMFAPLGTSRFVLGGGFTGSRSGINAFAESTLDLTPPLSPVPVFGLRTSKTTTDNAAYDGALLLARRLGTTEKTSLGFGVEYSHSLAHLKGSTTLNSNGVIGTSFLQTREDLHAHSRIERMQLRFGFAHEFAGGHKLGVFAHQGVGRANDSDESRTFNGLPLPLDKVRYASHWTEVGMRLRGPLSRKWYYGVQGAWLRVGLNEEIRRTLIVPAHEHEFITRAFAGAGLTYVLNPRTLFTFDAAGGTSRVSELLDEEATNNRLEDLRENTRFFSLHAAAQSDVWRQSFVTVSLLAMQRNAATTRALFPDQFGRRLTSYGLSLPDGHTRERLTDPVADFGGGWRFGRDFAVQYLYSTNFGRTPASHILLFRYNFGRRE